MLVVVIIDVVFVKLPTHCRNAFHNVSGITDRWSPSQ